MALIKNSFGGVDLLATVTEFDKRLTALEPKATGPEPTVTERVDEMLKTAASHAPNVEWTPTAPKKA